MPLFWIINKEVRCHGCNTPLILVKAWDGRLALMRHEGATSCRLYWKQYRVDRLTGYAEEAFSEPSPQPAEVQLQAQR